jgi:hypothetical protein
MRRSPGHHPSPFATRTADTAGERLGLEPPPNTIRFFHTLNSGHDSRERSGWFAASGSKATTQEVLAGAFKEGEW